MSMVMLEKFGTGDRHKQGQCDRVGCNNPSGTKEKCPQCRKYLAKCDRSFQRLRSSLRVFAGGSARHYPTFDQTDDYELGYLGKPQRLRRVTVTFQ